MTKTLTQFTLALILLHGDTQAATLTLSAPLDYQVFQRQTKTTGDITVAGKLTGSEDEALVFEVRLQAANEPGRWRTVEAKRSGEAFEAKVAEPAGGWYQFDVRAVRASATHDDKPVAEAHVEHVGLGEVFVVAGQSNSANHGEEKQQTKSGKVAAFDGTRWQLANDPQPGASGDAGSFMPPLGDALARRLQVPIGFCALGIGASSVREWLPAGETFPNPPTILSRVRKLADGNWESDGQAFERLTTRMKQLGPHGFRAVLWHQGESDANQSDPSRTLPGKLYREYLEKILHAASIQSGSDAPWFVAQVSYHTPGDESSPDIRAAQASLWKDGIALEGPDSDALKRKWREANGAGVHFSGPGLREHAARWTDKLVPWIEKHE